MENSTAQEFMEDVLSNLILPIQPTTANTTENIETFTLQENQIEKWLEDESYEHGFRWVTKSGYRSIDNRQNVSIQFLFNICYLTSP